MTSPCQVRISFYGNLRQAAGRKSVNFTIQDQLTVKGLLGELIKLIPGFKPELINDDGQLHANLNVQVNGRDIRFLDGELDYLLGDGDQVNLFPALSGGHKGIM